MKVDTPLGTHNPDWAVLVEVDGEKKLYFVVESKGAISPDDLRPAEKARIDCGKKHFNALDNGVKFSVKNTFEEFSREYVLLSQA